MNGFQNPFAWLTGMIKLIFDFSDFFGSGHFFDPSQLKKMAKKDRSKKIQKSKKSCFFMPIDHTKKFLKSVHTKTLFLEPFSQIFEQLFVNGEAFLKKLF